MSALAASPNLMALKKRLFIGNGQRAGHSQIYCVGMRVSDAAEACRRSAENLALGVELDVNFQSDDYFPGHNF